ncbi:class I SAM-dependent methyltransferase [Pseudooceanicola sp. LIPI14-2-Ac024]|uniref:class I SAM-dependent methyltransferase n=1 Tax=Pseudooceanicola sp. LIPI14-2-Ac024 TaxID=3344875 RepID=UPI0035CF405C
MFWRKKGPPEVTREPDFPELPGPHYLDFLAGYHRAVAPGTYLEIGTQKGRSLAPAGGHCIAIDPEFRLDVPVTEGKESLYLYQGPSDDFFASGYLDRQSMTFDLAFLDGMHLFEFLLRDFVNAEARMAPGGRIVLHDCIPFARIMADRDWDRTRTLAWTGDVWKLVPILKRFRPDLQLEVLDCPPTGLVLISDLDPGSRVLAEAMEDIVAEYLPLTLDGYGVPRYLDEIGPLVSGAGVLERLSPAEDAP